ncbi:hypothetical protein [Rubellicoccus peritrichatus]|uniref:Uncharacterized protein n=1 Tax=Rubellicoccus peritrichatus TaxID=3080537 RepID=A0AAQ3LE47_9BACT|nr:hypothetical protein [Puniceicoccus sp. CR14]WOO42819.1 hypothetical protein RZN69_06920 [Puniceicoccus sp. CR14]
MNYEELKIIWDSQKEETVYMIDNDALLKSVKHKNASVSRLVICFEITAIIVAFSTAIILSIDAWRENGGLDEYIVAAICLAVGIYACFQRKRRKSSEPDFDQSMFGLIEKTLSQIDYHVKSLRTFLWCFHLPIALVAGIGLTVYSNTRTPLIWIGVMLICAFSYWSTQRDIRKKFLPEKRNLEALRDKLLNVES